MLFEVVYHADPESELADLWLKSTDKKGFNQALQRIDQFLSSNPRKYGDEVSEELFAIEVPPLKIFFEIDETKFTVEVTGIGLIES